MDKALDDILNLKREYNEAKNKLNESLQYYKLTNLSFDEQYAFEDVNIYEYNAKLTNSDENFINIKHIITQNELSVDKQNVEKIEISNGTIAQIKSDFKKFNPSSIAHINLENNMTKNEKKIVFKLLIQLFIEYSKLLEFFDINNVTEINNEQIIGYENGVCDICKKKSNVVIKVKQSFEENYEYFCRNCNQLSFDLEGNNFRYYDENKLGPLVNIETVQFLFGTILLKIRVDIDNNYKLEMEKFIIEYSKMIDVSILHCKCNHHNCNESKLCKFKNNPLSFWDSRNYSITMCLNYINFYNVISNSEQYILIYDQTKNYFSSHIFNIYYPSNNTIEAISVQISLNDHLKSLCMDVSAGLSLKLFDYILNFIIPLKKPKYIYAYAWKTMSEILVTKMGFNTLTSSNDEKEKYVITSRIRYMTQNINADDVRNLGFETVSLKNSNYIFTFKFFKY